MKKYFIALLMITLLLPFFVVAQIFTPLASTVNQSLLGIHFTDNDTGYACGDGGVIIKTTDAGNSWSTLVSGTTANLWDIKTIPGSEGQKVIVTGDNNTIKKSYDGGITWQSQSIPFQAGSFVFGIQCLDSLNYFACGGDFATFSGAVLKTTNGGISWTKTPVASSIFLDKIMFASSSVAYSVGTNTSFADGSIQKSTDGGATWSLVKSSPNTITHLWCINPSTVIAIGLAGQIWRTTDGGTTWNDHSFNTKDLFAIQFIDSLNGFACGGDANNIILRTINGGISWSQINYNFNGRFLSIYISPLSIYVSGDNGHIAKSAIPTDVTSIEENSRNYSVSLYPNPASTRLHINGKELRYPACLQLFNTSGILAEQASIDNGYKSIDITKLLPGLYFYKISLFTGEMIQTGKIIIQ